MPIIPSGTSLYAPAVAESNGSLAALWTNSANQQMLLSVYNLNSLSWSVATAPAGCGSQTRPALAFWNGTFYDVHIGVTGDTKLYTYMTDLAFFPPNPLVVGPYTSPWIPWTFPFGNSLIITENQQPGQSTTQVSYFAFNADWFGAGQSTLWSAAATNVTLPNPLTRGACVIVCPTAQGILWCIVYGQDSSMYHYCCFDQNWNAGQGEQIPNACPSSFPAVTVYDGNIYAAWVDSVLNASVYSVGTPSAPGPGISWSAPTTIPGVPTGTTDLSITAGTDGIFVGYCVPNSSLGVVQLGP
ncbi:hypothetical protein [Longimicrobium sp.]|uniref:hypothetical protein n=1 Tax=Longimicrobium sp. TaxID=2029185 RepID=UPI003B3B5579